MAATISEIVSGPGSEIELQLAVGIFRGIGQTRLVCMRIRKPFSRLCKRLGSNRKGRLVEIVVAIAQNSTRHHHGKR